MPSISSAVDALGQQRLGPGKGEQPSGQRSGAGRAFHRIVEVHHDLPSRPVQTPERQVDAADDHGEHIVEVVRDAAGQLADGFHLLDLAKLRLGRLAFGRLRLQRLIGFPQFLGAFAHRLLELLGADRLRLGGASACAFWRSAWNAITPRKTAPTPTRRPSQLR